MNLFVLSQLQPKQNHVGWAVNHTLEDVIRSTCGVTFLYPSENNEIALFNQLKLTCSGEDAINRFRHRLFKSWYNLEKLPTLGKGPNILLVVGLNIEFLLSMHALGPLLKQFDLRLGYLLDGIHPDDIDRTVLPYLDHLFVISAEIAEETQSRLGLSSSFLPLATNTIHSTLNLHRYPRWIDIISYGRGNKEFHKFLQGHFNSSNDDRVYHHSTFAEPYLYDRAEHIALMTKLLDRSKISVCFEASSVERFRGYSPILYRWFEAWAAGCTVIGRKPFGQGVAELMDWENSAIDIPENPADWALFIEALLADNDTLQENAQRNYQECLLRHDWRYRLRDMFNQVGLPLPDSLTSQIADLQEKARDARISAMIPLPSLS
ncbi:MAG: hypothetical protein Kow00121_48420 [Elainellaceae cyanobacterium]